MHKAIDIHGHFGNPERFPQSNLEKEMYRISLESLKKNYVQQGITAACISPMEGIFPDNTDALLDANCYMEELAEEQDWIYQWVIVNPLMPASFHQAEKILKKMCGRENSSGCPWLLHRSLWKRSVCFL